MAHSEGGRSIAAEVVRVARASRRATKVWGFLRSDNFNLEHQTWNRVFLDQETGTLRTDRSRRDYAVRHILAFAGIETERTKKQRDRKSVV